MQRIYMDYAAATPMDERVLRAMEPFFTTNFYNPSALYSGARDAKQALENARSEVSSILGCRSSELVFCAGGTESVNMAIRGVMQAYPEAEIMFSAIEHDAVREPAQKYTHTMLPVDERGIVQVSETKKLIHDNVVLLSVMYVNNEIGSVQPLAELAKQVSEIRAERHTRGITLPLFLHSDACQAPLYLDCHVARLGVDLLTLNGSKMYGPKQSGILYIRAGVPLQPLIRGGGQEWGMRSGTENVAFAVGFATALKLAEKGRHITVKTVRELRDYFMGELENRFDAKIVGHRYHRVANNIYVIFEGCDNERVLFALDELGVDAATGSACSASKETSSHVLQALGLTEKDAQSSLRFTIGKKTTRAEVDTVLEKLTVALKA